MVPLTVIIKTTTLVTANTRPPSRMMTTRVALPRSRLSMRAPFNEFACIAAKPGLATEAARGSSVIAHRPARRLHGRARPLVGQHLLLGALRAFALLPPQ